MIYNKLLLLKSLPLPPDILNEIHRNIKYDLLEKIYIDNFKKLNKHFLYYCWLNKKLNKKDKLKISILKTIKEYDYYKN